MTVGDLIEELKKFDKDLNVRVQFRDSGGEYCGTDDELYLLATGNELIL
jgi:hypothetical protein